MRPSLSLLGIQTPESDRLSTARTNGLDNIHHLCDTAPAMKKRTNIYLSQEQFKRLAGLRKKSGATMAEQIRRAIDAWLDKEEKKT